MREITRKVWVLVSSAEDWITLWEGKWQSDAKTNCGAQHQGNRMKNDGPHCTGAQTRDLSLLLALNFRKYKAQIRRLEERHLCCCSSCMMHTNSYQGSAVSRAPHSALQQGEGAQGSSFRRSQEADGHHRQCRFTLSVVASG